MPQSKFPLIAAFKQLTKARFFADLNGGLLVGVLLIPQGMAYAFLAGMPPIYGLYGALLPLVVYAFLGTSPTLSIGPVAISAILLLEGVSKIATPFTPEYINLVILAGFLIGCFQVLMGIIRSGYLVNFISQPVLSGFTSAAAVIIILNQLKDVLGMTIPRFQFPHETLFFASQHLDTANLIALVIFFIGILLMFILKKINTKIPYAFIAVILSILAVKFMHLDEKGLDIMGAIKPGLPAFAMPDITLEKAISLIPVMLTVGMIGLVESISIAKMMEDNSHTVRPNQEFWAVGLSKVVASFFNALPSSASFSRSAVNHQSGASSQISSLVAALIVLITLVALTPLFFYLPKAILAAIIIFSVVKLFDYQRFIHLWKSHKGDFSIMLFTFLSILLVGIEAGILLGIILSLILILYRSSQPKISVLGRVPGTTYYRDVTMYHTIERFDKQLIIRLENQLYFANASFFKEKIKTLIAAHKGELETLILDAKSIYDIDSSGIKALEEIIFYLKENNIQLKICGSLSTFRDRLICSGLMERIEPRNLYIYLNDALAADNEFKGATGEKRPRPFY